MLSSKNLPIQSFFKKDHGFTKASIHFNNSTGFTLIELLVVIVIAAVLLAILISNILDIRLRARDNRRKQDIQQIQTALEFYRSENGVYPPMTPYGIYSDPCPTPSALKSLDDPKTYMEEIPCDPNPPTSGTIKSYIYQLQSETSYVMAACLENVNDKNVTPHFLCESGRGWFIVSNP